MLVQRHPGKRLAPRKTPLKQEFARDTGRILPAKLHAASHQAPFLHRTFFLKSRPGGLQQVLHTATGDLCLPSSEVWRRAVRLTADIIRGVHHFWAFEFAAHQSLDL
jgi:hypothetical protein